MITESNALLKTISLNPQ